MAEQERRLTLYRRGEARLQKLARIIERELPKGMVFVLHIGTPNPEGGVGYGGYVSNGDRAQMIAAIREAADTLEARGDVPPGAPIPAGRA
ncbi:hypothetical protein [Albimonas pacifica]|uniref:Uncharacterized protein n=1 Tax=Albimonas pacifica TaxID=1114924 RepID=A0A1I3JIL5_9RHOB|nr:hypothetical protein [Albimonas pacifica]SFI59828.1 hypothetical protein SAMN05216258_10815 [Albimonas pacifica]